MATGYNKWLKSPLEPSIKWSEDGRLYGITRRWEIDSSAADPATIETECFLPRGTTDAEYTNALLIDQGIGDGTPFGVKQAYYRVYQELPANSATLIQIGKDALSYTDNGLALVEQRFVGNADHVLTGTVGTTTANVGGLTGLVLSGNAFAERGQTVATVVKRWAEPGILDAKRENKGGLLYVTFISQGTKFTPTALNGAKALTDIETEAFQGGAAAPVRYSRVRDVSGFRKFTVTVMLQKDGSALASGTEVKSRTTWENYQYPGKVNTSLSSSIVPIPGGNVPILVKITETMTKTGDLAITPSTPAPFAIKQGCYVNITYKPVETGLAESLTKAFGTNYLAGSLSITTLGTVTFLDMDVTGLVAGGGSDPTHAQFLGNADYGGTGVRIDNPILARPIVEDFVTDEGDQWYRIQEKTLVGKFGDYI